MAGKRRRRRRRRWKWVGDVLAAHGRRCPAAGRCRPASSRGQGSIEVSYAFQPLSGGDATSSVRGDGGGCVSYDDGDESGDSDVGDCLDNSGASYYCDVGSGSAGGGHDGGNGGGGVRNDGGDGDVVVWGDNSLGSGGGSSGGLGSGGALGAACRARGARSTRFRWWAQSFRVKVVRAGDGHFQVAPGVGTAAVAGVLSCRELRELLAESFALRVGSKGGDGVCRQRCSGLDDSTLARLAPFGEVGRFATASTSCATPIIAGIWTKSRVIERIISRTGCPKRSSLSEDQRARWRPRVAPAERP